MRKILSGISPFLWVVIACLTAFGFLASYRAETSPQLVRLAGTFERLLHCPPDKAPSGFQFFRLLRALAFLPFLLALAAAWHSRQARRGETASWDSLSHWPIILFGCFLRMDLWATKAFWCDTWALKAGIATHTATELLTGPLGFNQSAPIGFSLLSKAIGSLTANSDLAMTLPLLLASCLALIALSHLARRLLRPESPFLAALFVFIFAINPSFVYYGAEFKPYGIDLLMSTLALVVLFRFKDGKACFSELLFFSILAPAFSLPSFFVLPFLYLALLVRFRKEKRNASRVLLCGLAAAPVAAFAIVHAFSTMPAAMDNVQDLFAPVAFTKDAALWWIGRIMHSFRGPAYFGFTTWSISSLGILLSSIPLGLFLVGAWKARGEAWTWMSLAVIAATALASACHYWKINPGASLTSGRLILFLAPFAYLPLAHGLLWVFRKYAVAGKAISFFAMASCVLFFAQQVPISCPMDPIASRISSEWNSGDVLLTDEIMLLSLLDANENWVKQHSSDIRMVYSSSSYDDSEFRSLDSFAPGIKRVSTSEIPCFLKEMEECFGTTTGGFLLFYAFHGNSRDTARSLREIRPSAILDSISSPLVEFSAVARQNRPDCPPAPFLLDSGACQP